MMFYIGGTVLATSVATSLATKVVTSTPGFIINALSRLGYSYSTAKSSYDNYYKRMVNKGPLYERILDILVKNSDKAYATCLDPRDTQTWMSADVLCFRNSTSFYDYSSFGCARARLCFDYTTGCAIIICKKKSELEDFSSRLEHPDFNFESLVFVGVG